MLSLVLTIVAAMQDPALAPSDHYDDARDDAAAIVPPPNLNRPFAGNSRGPSDVGAASPVNPAPSNAAPEDYRWYGGPAVAIDAASLALMVAGVAANRESLLVAGGVGYLLGAPIAHWASAQPGHSAASLGIRVLGGGIATGAMLIDFLSHPCDGEPSCQHSLSTGLAVASISLLSAMLVDDVWLARDRTTRDSEGARLGVGLSVGPDLRGVSIGGTF